MKNHTLGEFIGYYKNVQYIQLVYGNHLVNIDLNSTGSYALVKVFKNEHFRELGYTNTNILMLEHI